MSLFKSHNIFVSTCFVVKVFHIQCQRFTIKFDVGILKDDVIAELNSFVRRVEFVGPETRHRPWGWLGFGGTVAGFGLEQH